MVIVKPDIAPPLSRRALEGGCATDGVSKRRYRRRADAIKALRQMQSQRGGSTLNAYECGKCRCWHIGNSAW
jgi:hypothetical protein